MTPRRVALVTGGAKRIGAAIVRRLLAADYAVAIHCRGSRAEADLLAATAPDRTAIVVGDLADPGIARLVPEAAAALGPLTLLVNNASLFDDDRLETLTAERFDAHMAVNLRAPLLLAQAFAAHVFAAKAPAGTDPSIVNIVDQRVFKLTPQHMSYTLSKAGLQAATRTLAQALAPRIRVNGVAPGPTAPNPHDGAAGMAKEAAGTPLGLAIRPEDIAEAVLYLAGASRVTAQTLAVDSGQSAGWLTPDIVTP